MIFILLCFLGFIASIVFKWADGTIAYNNAYCVEIAKQRAQPKTWDQLWKESGLTDADIPELIKALEILKKEKIL